MTKSENAQLTELRDLIVEVAADLSNNNPFWTAGLLADALIGRGVKICTKCAVDGIEHNGMPEVRHG